MQKEINENQLAFHADRIIVMGWIKRLSNQVKELAASEGLSSEIEKRCDEIKHSSNDMLAVLYDDAFRCGFTAEEIQEFAIAWVEGSGAQAEQLPHVCGSA